MMEKKELNKPTNPVWDVYDELRTARLNVLYYDSQIKILTRWNVIIEWLSAITTSSTVAGFWIWANIVGGYVWKSLGAVAALLAIGRPILNLTNKIIRKGELLAAYKELDSDFNHLRIKINEKKKYDSELKKEFHNLINKKKEITKNDKDEYMNQKLRSYCTDHVNLELPPEMFFVPKEENENA